MRKNIIIALAGCLIFASASAAASRYLITSTRQIKPSVLRQLHGNRGPRGYAGIRGATGPQGATGPGGAPGSFSASNVSVVQGAAVYLCPSGQAQSCNVGGGYAMCPAGAIVTGGGWDSSGLVNTTVGQNKPFAPLGGSANEWFVLMSNSSSISESFTPYAVCAQ